MLATWLAPRGAPAAPFSLGVGAALLLALAVVHASGRRPGAASERSPTPRRFDLGRSPALTAGAALRGARLPCHGSLRQSRPSGLARRGGGEHRLPSGPGDPGRVERARDPPRCPPRPPAPAQGRLRARSLRRARRARPVARRRPDPRRRLPRRRGGRRGPRLPRAPRAPDPRGEVLTRGEGEGAALYQAVRSAMSPIVGPRALAPAATLDPAVAGWTGPDDPRLLLALTDLRLAMLDGVRHGPGRSGAALEPWMRAEIPPVSGELHGELDPLPVDRTSPAAFARSAPAHVALARAPAAALTLEAASLADEAAALAAAEPSPAGRVALAVAEADLRAQAGDPHAGEGAPGRDAVRRAQPPGVDHPGGPLLARARRASAGQACAAWVPEAPNAWNILGYTDARDVEARALRPARLHPRARAAHLRREPRPPSSSPRAAAKKPAVSPHISSPRAARTHAPPASSSRPASRPARAASAPPSRASAVSSWSAPPSAETPPARSTWRPWPWTSPRPSARAAPWPTSSPPNLRRQGPSARRPRPLLPGPRGLRVRVRLPPRRPPLLRPPPRPPRRRLLQGPGRGDRPP